MGTTIGRQMIEAAGRATRILPAASVRRIFEFVESRRNNDGGFQNRAGKSDLYYTIFGLQCIAALGRFTSLAKSSKYVAGFRSPEELDFVHLSCLARCFAPPAPKADRALADGIAVRIEQFRTSDGGYHVLPRADHGTVYACFLAILAYEGLRREIPNAAGMIACIQSLETSEGGYANEPRLRFSTTTATAAACLALPALGAKPGPAAKDVLLKREIGGGFLAMAESPMPDLLSTATALHALAGLGAPLSSIRNACVDFVEDMWQDSGGFCGTKVDGLADCEYTFYSLLALGNLA